MAWTIHLKQPQRGAAEGARAMATALLAGRRPPISNTEGSFDVQTVLSETGPRSPGGRSSRTGNGSMIGSPRRACIRGGVTSREAPSTLAIVCGRRFDLDAGEFEDATKEQRFRKMLPPQDGTRRLWLSAGGVRRNGVERRRGNVHKGRRIFYEGLDQEVDQGIVEWPFMSARLPKPCGKGRPCGFGWWWAMVRGAPMSFSVIGFDRAYDWLEGACPTCGGCQSG